MSRLVPLLVLAACQAPDPTGLFNDVEVVPTDAAGVSERFVAAIDGASESLAVALSGGDDLAIAEALLAADERGVELEIVTDFDLAAAPGIAPLLDAGLPVRLADAGLTYFEFSLGEDIGWPSTDTIMSHAHVVADRQRIVAATEVGTPGAGTRIAFEVRGEEIVEDLLDEHTQVFGGTDATAVDAYDAQSKSIVDVRWRYGTPSAVDLQLWFGPQERLVKRVIDAVYSARSSVWILTDELASEGLAYALEDKARLGFDVKVIVGPSFGTSSDALARIFEQSTPTVDRRRTADEVVPTLVLVDYNDQPSGIRPLARAMVITHDLYSAARLYRGDRLVTDQLIDGACWELVSTQAPDGAMLDLLAVFQDQLDRAGGF